MRAAGLPKDYVIAKNPLVNLIGELTRQADHQRIYVQKGDLSLQLEKKKNL